MSIWGRRDSEPPAEEAHDSQAEAHDSQAEAHDAQETASENQAEEPAPAFWRAQGETPESLGRDPADAPPPDYEHVPADPPPAGVPPTMGPAPAYGQQAAGEGPVGTDSEAPAGADAAAPVLTGVVLDDETAVKDPAQTMSHGAEAQEPAVTEVPEPTVAVAREPVVDEARESAPSEAQQPVVTGDELPVVAGDEPSAAAPEPVVAEAQEPAVTEVQEPAVAEVQEPAAIGAEQPAAAAIASQRWSEILVAFVDDPRSSVKMAADAVDEAIGEFVDSVRARQRDLASTWQGAEAGTEQLRTALREYRKLGQRVQQLDLGEKTGG